MLLDDVENAISTNVRIVTKEVQKTDLCTLPYTVEIKELYLSKFLRTDTGIYIDNKPYTTFSSHTYYNKESINEGKNVFDVECLVKIKENVYTKVSKRIGYVNNQRYLHLPDFLSTELLKIGSEVYAVLNKTILFFENGYVKVYTHNTPISKPYYVYNFEFEYNENAELLATIIGLTDIYKRKETDRYKQYYYFIYPFVSLILYKKLSTTAYPPYINLIVTDVINKLEKRINEELNKYLSNLNQNISVLIKRFNDGDKMIVE